MDIQSSQNKKCWYSISLLIKPGLYVCSETSDKEQSPDILKDIDVVEIDLCENSAECVWAKIVVRGQEPILAGCFYRTNREHTTAQIEEPEKTLMHVQDNQNPNGKYTVLLGGDFNVPYIDWETLTISSECDNRKMYDKLLDVIDENEMQQLQHQPTCCGSVLDLFFSNKPSLIKDITVIPGISDHDAVVVDTVFTIKLNRKLPRHIRQWSKTDWDKVREEVTQYRDSYFHKASSQPVEDNYKSFQDFIKELIDTYVPSKMSSVHRNVPWCTPAIKRMCQKKQRLYNKYRKSHLPRDWEAFKAHQRATVAALRKARWEYIGGMLNDGLESGNHKPFWRYVKSQRQDNCGASPLKRNGELHSNSKDKAQILNDQFSSVFTKDDQHAGTVLEGPSLPPLAGLNISEKGVAKLLKEIDPSKAGGPDEVPCRILKELADDIAPILTDIYRQSLSTRVLPNIWKTAYVSPIFKKGAVCEAENYRPVNLTCIPCKILEHIICSHLRRHLDIHGALSPLNHGFRKHHSCDTQLIISIQDLLTRKDPARSQVDIGVLDFAKAFDKVPHGRLLSKLRIYGIDGEVARWIGAFLNDCTQAVIVDGSTSDQPKSTLVSHKEQCWDYYYFCYSSTTYHQSWIPEQKYASSWMIA